MLSRLRRTAAPEAGISVIELTITLSVFLIIVTAMYTLFTVVNRTTVRQDKRNQVGNEMQLAMERMTKEVRQATNIYPDSSASSIHIDTYSNGTPITVTWAASGTTLTRTAGGATITFLTRLTTVSVFTYSPSTTGATDIIISLNARPQRFSGDPAVVTLTSQVRLRNRGSS